MATQTVVTPSFPSLTAPKIGVYNATTGVEVVAPDTASVVGAASVGYYSRAFTDLTAGRYAVVVFDGALEMDRDYLTVAATTGTYFSDSMQAITVASTLMQSTTIATLTSQTVFTLTAGSADNDAYKDALIVITDAATATQKARGEISAYTGATMTVTLYEAPAFTIAVGDAVEIFAEPNYRLRQVQTGVAYIQSAVLAGSTVAGFGLVDSDGVLQLKQGSTVTLTFTSSSPNIVSDMSSAKVFLCIETAAGRKLVQVEGSVVSPTGTQIVSFSPSSAEALKIAPGKHKFDVVVLYGYDSDLTPSYDSLELFTYGFVQVNGLAMDSSRV